MLIATSLPLADRISVRQRYYRWLIHPVSHCELAEAYLANALFDRTPPL